MAFSFSDKYLKDVISKEDMASMSAKVNSAHNTLKNRTGEGSDFLGWVELPKSCDKAEVRRISETAEMIRSLCDVFIVIGIGGSYLGARAAIGFVNGAFYNCKKSDSPEIYFVGNDISSSHLRDILDICKDKDVCVNVISKSGTTTEPAIAFRFFKKLLIEKYGEYNIKYRIYMTTDKARGALRSQVNETGYTSFVIDDDIGGRYSVLTPVVCFDSGSRN